MKKITFSLILLISSLNFLTAQFEFNIKAGMHSIDLVNDGIILPNDDGQGLQFNFLDSKYGIHFGFSTRISLLGIYIEPSFLLNSTSIDYTIDDFGDQGVFNVVKNETYNSFDIPVVFGIKAGILRLYGGPVAHLHINGSSDLVDFPGYEQRFKDGTYGFQAGIGLDIWKIRIDAGFEGNLNKFGDHIYINDQSYKFDTAASRLLLTVGYKL